MTWYCRLVRLSMGGSARADQFVPARAEACCNTNSVEGITHARRSPFDGIIFSLGQGVVCEIQMPPLKTVAASLLPSADEAIEFQPWVLEALFDTQALPESADV